MNIAKAVYAFDIDDTLAFTGAKRPGSVTLMDVMKLRNQGIVTGICGNYKIIMDTYKDWYQYFSFYGPAWPGITELNRTPSKDKHLKGVKELIRAEKYVMVGNKATDKGVHAGSQDDVYARRAGWEFIDQEKFGSIRGDGRGHLE